MRPSNRFSIFSEKKIADQLNADFNGHGRGLEAERSTLQSLEPKSILKKEARVKSSNQHITFTQARPATFITDKAYARYDSGVDANLEAYIKANQKMALAQKEELQRRLQDPNESLSYPELVADVLLKHNTSTDLEGAFDASGAEPARRKNRRPPTEAEAKAAEAAFEEQYCKPTL